MDYSKAFDLVDHTILVEKFKSLGVPAVLVRWLCGFLSDHQQRVKIGQEISDWLTLKGAMPQGSWLGPLCFLVHISDLTSPLHLHKYIDDTSMSEVIDDLSRSQMQKAANDMLKWSELNNMKLNGKKTKEMIINFSRSQSDIPALSIDHIPLERVANFKLLGIWLANNLSWDKHMDVTLKKTSTRIYFLKQLKRGGLSAEDLTTFYITIVRPVMEYACQVWHSGLTKGQADALEAVQKRAMRIIFPDKNYNCALVDAGLPPLAERRAALCKKLFNAICEESNSLNYLVPKPRDTGYKTRNGHKFPVPRIKNERFKSSFIIHSLLNYQ